MRSNEAQLAWRRWAEEAGPDDRLSSIRAESTELGVSAQNSSSSGLMMSHVLAFTYEYVKDTLLNI